MRRIVLLLTLAACGSSSAGIITYRQSGTGACPTERCVSLGYPVPVPVDSQTPVAGFRSYASLQARLQDLAATSDDLRAETVGETHAGRPIMAYVVGDADTTTPDGFLEPAMLQNGGIHAREWAAPEVVASIAERLLQNAGDGGFHRYLLDAATIILVPSLNVDGFLQTQRYPDTAQETTFAGDGPGWPRDGRMRRKNMRSDDGTPVDEDLSTTDDFLFGVDNNRNNAPYFDSGIQNSDDQRSLIYHGLSAGSEAENQALYAAAALGPLARLRYYVDTHSFSRVFFGLETGNGRRDAVARALHATMNAATGNRYPYLPSSPGNGIGSTDEYFGQTRQVPSYTLEIEPVNSAAEYGGFGADHDGFILPANQISRVRNELSAAALIGMYRMAGPPSVDSVRLSNGGTTAFAGQWQAAGATARSFEITTPADLDTGIDYRLKLAFNRPMRVRNGAGQVTQFTGQNATLAPRIALEVIAANGAYSIVDACPSASDWQAGGERYAGDTIEVTLQVPPAVALANARRVSLLVDAQDASGQRLDANPATAADYGAPGSADYGGWTRYEGVAADTGGPDRSAVLVDDGSAAALPASPPAASCGGAAPADTDRGGGTTPPLLLLAGLCALVSRRRRS